VREHRALGLAGRPGRVAEERQVGRARARGEQRVEGRTGGAGEPGRAARLYLRERVHAHARRRRLGARGGVDVADHDRGAQRAAGARADGEDGGEA
jgi:hypothetical protein